MIFQTEQDFEDALVNELTTKYGWSPDVLYRSTEDDLIQNWANILFENNKDEDRLNHQPLTVGEMNQILEQIKNK
ncbi:MAG: hypothetical protein IJV56_08850 [Neisseriaceae bacterium]|nr:hypothetical protein [Neisseriaceae bacterium]